MALRFDCDFNQQLDLGLAGLSVFDVQSLDDEKLAKAVACQKSLRSWDGSDASNNATRWS